MYQIFVYAPEPPLATFTWLVIYQGKCIATNSQPTYNAALKQAASQLKQYADTLS